MAGYILRRTLLAIPTLFGISTLSFGIMHLAPGDFLTTYAAKLAQQGEGITAEQLEQPRQAYGLGEPIYVQYWKWMSAILLRADFGLSMQWHMPVAGLIWDRLGWTVLLTGITILIGYMIARHGYAVHHPQLRGHRRACRHVVVMYCGRPVEYASADDIFDRPAHPYTQALLRSIPRLGKRDDRLPVIRGMVPDPFHVPAGCAFHTRCPSYLSGVCDSPEYVNVGPEHRVLCSRV